MDVFDISSFYGSLNDSSVNKTPNLPATKQRSSELSNHIVLRLLQGFPMTLPALLPPLLGALFSSFLFFSFLFFPRLALNPLWLSPVHRRAVRRLPRTQRPPELLGLPPNVSPAFGVEAPVPL